MYERRNSQSLAEMVGADKKPRSCFRPLPVTQDVFLLALRWRNIILLSFPFADEGEGVGFRSQLPEHLSELEGAPELRLRG